MKDASTLPGVLLTQAGESAVVSWVRRGTVPGYVLPLGGWTAVVPAGASGAAPPYDDGLTMTAARALPRGLRPGIGMFVMDERAIVVLQIRHGDPAWLAWTSATGSVVVPEHRAVEVLDLMEVAGLDPAERDNVVAVLGRRSGTAIAMLTELSRVLGLPGADLLSGKGIPLRPEAVLVTPNAKRAEHFDRDVAEEHELRRELTQEQE
ncbi:hypothetical protein ACMYYO_08965 [Dermacoccaceae bacterium W4C1]